MKTFPHHNSKMYIMFHELYIVKIRLRIKVVSPNLLLKSYDTLNANVSPLPTVSESVRYSEIICIS